MNSYLVKACLILGFLFLFSGCRKDKTCTCTWIEQDGSTFTTTETVGPDEICGTLNFTNPNSLNTVSRTCVEN